MLSPDRHWPQGQGKPKGATAESVRTFDTDCSCELEDSWRIQHKEFVKSQLGGGNWQLKYVFYVHPENWGRWNHFDYMIQYFFDRLKPPTSQHLWFSTQPLTERCHIDLFFELVVEQNNQFPQAEAKPAEGSKWLGHNERCLSLYQYAPATNI